MSSSSSSSAAAAPKRTGTQAIERAIGVLRLFAQPDVELSLRDVSRASGLATATSHRILASLVRERLLTYDASIERYRIGPDSLFLFASAAQRYGISAARSELERLVSEVHETASLGVLDGADTIVVLQAESDLPLRFSRPVGTRVPLHVSAMGKAILAFSELNLDEAVAQLDRLQAFTEFTITDHQALIDELQTVRERGWAVNDNERYAGVRAIAVPIIVPDLHVRASVGVQGPNDRLSDARLEEVVAAVTHSAQRLAVHLEITF